MTLTRVAQVPYTFSDGTSVPAGTMVGAAALPAHRDETRYTDADTFKPDRFVEEFHGDEGARVRHSMSTTSNNYRARLSALPKSGYG